MGNWVSHAAPHAPYGEIGGNSECERAARVHFNVQQRARRVELCRTCHAVTTAGIGITAGTGSHRRHRRCLHSEPRDSILRCPIQKKQRAACLRKLLQRFRTCRPKSSHLFRPHRTTAMSILNTVGSLIGYHDGIVFLGQATRLDNVPPKCAATGAFPSNQ